MGNKGKAVPRGKIARTRVVGGVLAKAAGKKISGGAKGFLASAEKKQAIQAETREEIARILFEGLSKLRGTALKLAQVFVGETGLLPKEYLSALEQSHYKTPPLSTALVRSMLNRELKKDFNGVFAEFDWGNARAASLGQVHRARLVDGRDVAVKIQYPGIKEAIVSDFKMVRAFASPLSNNALLMTILDELEDRVHKEVDYLFEVGQQKWFAQQNGLLKIPRVHSQHCTSRLIVMDYVEGVHLDEWALSRPPQEKVDQVCEHLLCFFLDSVFKWGRVHVDPNFGNYILTAGGDLYAVDFGAVKELPPEDRDFYKALWLTGPQADKTALLEEYRRRGASFDPAQPEEVADFLAVSVDPYLEWLHAFLGAEVFDFQKEEQFVAKGHEIFTSQLFNPRMQEFSAELTFIHRNLLGLFTICRRLGARFENPARWMQR